MKIARLSPAAFIPFFCLIVLFVRPVHAAFPFTYLDAANLPPKVAAYQLEVQEMSRNPLYDFSDTQYATAQAMDEDATLKDACFHGAGEQNTDAGHDLYKESTLNKIEDPNVVTGVQSLTGTCMPHKITKRFSPLDLNKWFLVSVMSLEGVREPLQQSAYRGGGGQNPYFNSQRMVLPTQTMQMGCAVDLMVSDVSGQSDPLDPIWMRRELDNCTNQYILQHSRFLRDPDDAQGRINTVNTGICQPFRLELPPTRHELYEYVPSEYIGVAWVKLLMDETYLYRKGASETEPNYGKDTQVKVVKSIPVPADKFGMILVEDLAEKEKVNLQFEKIIDPSHPYTPRWDFERTDRSYSGLATPYGGNPENAVRCSDDVEVDLLNFRKHMFDPWIIKKTSFNTMCYNTPWCHKYIWEPLKCSSDEPCCSTRWNVADKFKMPGISRAICGVPMYQVCNYVARPLTGMNTLKLRAATPENFPQGVPEGYGFKDYFGDHKPYMRCWDSNTECGETAETFPTPIKGGTEYAFAYNAGSTVGSDYALMGAGREGESCTIGGGKGMGGVANPDPISSWSELKLYYVRTMNKGAKCISLHTKFFKSREGEDITLTSMGANISLLKPDNSLQNVVWPIKTWKGFISDPDNTRRFPNLNGTPPIEKGLDDATVGEILLFDEDVVMQGAEGTWRNPYIAQVKANVNERFRRQIKNGADATLDPAQDHLTITPYSHGRYIDACAMSDESGMGADITIYKTKLPPQTVAAMAELGEHTETCDDPRLSSCIEPYWNDVKRYSVYDDPF